MVSVCCGVAVKGLLQSTWPRSAVAALICRRRTLWWVRRLCATCYCSCVPAWTCCSPGWFCVVLCRTWHGLVGCTACQAPCCCCWPLRRCSADWPRTGFMTAWPPSGRGTSAWCVRCWSTASLRYQSWWTVTRASRLLRSGRCGAAVTVLTWSIHNKHCLSPLLLMHCCSMCCMMTAWLRNLEKSLGNVGGGGNLVRVNCPLLTSSSGLGQCLVVSCGLCLTLYYMSRQLIESFRTFHNWCLWSTGITDKNMCF